MLFRYILFVLLILSSLSCKIVTPNSKDNVWNGYKSDCTSKPIRYNYWPPDDLHFGKGTLYGNIRPVEKGFVALKNNDTIFGLIKINFTIPLPVLPNGKKAAGDIIRYDGHEINYFRVYNDSVTNTQCYLDFVPLPIPYNSCQALHIWRLLGKKNDISIFDLFAYGYNNPNKIAYLYKTILFSKNNYIKLYTWYPFRGIRGSLERFINRRYKTSVHKKDFKTIREMINYILDKENEKEASENKSSK
jgi:hypothetical protein